MNRRNFFGRLAGVIAGAFALWKTPAEITDCFHEGVCDEHWIEIGPIEDIAFTIDSGALAGIRADTEFFRQQICNGLEVPRRFLFSDEDKKEISNEIDREIIEDLKAQAALSS